MQNKNVLAIQCSNTQNEQYALFCDDNGLYHGNDDEGYVMLAQLDNINPAEKFIKIYYHFPYICVTERYGVNAAVVNISDANIRTLSRADYHCDVSSYGIGFLKHNDNVLLIHQTAWNRLDITNLETGELLTEREIIYRKTDEMETNQWGTFNKMESKNHIDYFHSLLHVSPDGKHFLSNGWAWHPVDYIMCFDTEQFLAEYETCGKDTRYARGYVWDRPCTFVNNDMFVIAADNDTVTAEEGVDEATLKEPPAYHQLLYYKLSEIKSGKYTYRGLEGYDTLPLAYSDKADCDIFVFNEYGEITGGELHYKPSTDTLVAISEKGAFELTLDGKILFCNTDIKISVGNWAIRRNDLNEVSHTDLLKNWQYDNVRDSFYRFNDGNIERRKIQAISEQEMNATK